MNSTDEGSSTTSQAAAARPRRRLRWVRTALVVCVLGGLVLTSGVFPWDRGYITIQGENNNTVVQLNGRSFVLAGLPWEDSAFSKRIQLGGWTGSSGMHMGSGRDILFQYSYNPWGKSTLSVEKPESHQLIVQYGDHGRQIVAKNQVYHLSVKGRPVIPID